MIISINKKVIIFFVFCFAFSYTTYSQTIWGEIDLKELDRRHCPFDSSAKAMVLFDNDITSI